MNDSLMHTTERCHACEGRATILSVGNLRKPCPNCNATGYIRHKIKVMSVANNPELKLVKARAKRTPKAVPEMNIPPIIKPFSTDDNVMVNTNKPVTGIE